jgi:hypothetical protein
MRNDYPPAIPSSGKRSSGYVRALSFIFSGPNPCHLVQDLNTYEAALVRHGEFTVAANQRFPWFLGYFARCVFHE